MSIIYKKHDLYPESILIRIFIGEVGIHENMDSWEYIYENNLISELIKGVITSLTGCDLIMDMVSFSKLISFLKTKKYLKGIKLAVVCDNPKTIVFPVLGEKHEHELKIKPFSTIEAASEWILL